MTRFATATVLVAFGLHAVAIGSVEPGATQSAICGTPDQSTRSAALCRWNKRRVFVYDGLRLSGVPRDEVRRSVRWACRCWSRVCGLELRPTDRGDLADVRMRLGGPADGVGCQPGLALARSQLPCTNQPVLQTYADCRIVDVGTLRRALLHELGHAIGIGHLPPGNIMDPNLPGHLTTLGRLDKREARLRYGPNPRKRNHERGDSTATRRGASIQF